MIFIFLQYILLSHVPRCSEKRGCTIRLTPHVGLRSLYFVKYTINWGTGESLVFEPIHTKYKEHNKKYSIIKKKQTNMIYVHYLAYFSKPSVFHATCHSFPQQKQREAEPQAVGTCSLLGHHFLATFELQLCFSRLSLWYSGLLNNNWIKYH